MTVSTIGEYRAKRAAARRAVFGQEPPAPPAEVRAFNAGYDAASPDWPLFADSPESQPSHITT